MFDESTSSSEDERADVSPFEQQLASLKPRSSSLDRDRLMFLAGQTAAARLAGPVANLSRATRFWQVVSGVSTLAATVLAILLAISSADRTGTHMADAAKPQLAAPTASPLPADVSGKRGPMFDDVNRQEPTRPTASSAAMLAMRKTLLSGDEAKLAFVDVPTATAANGNFRRARIPSIRDSQFELGLVKRPRLVNSFPWYPTGGTL